MDKPITGDLFSYTPYFTRVLKLYNENPQASDINRIARSVFLEAELKEPSGPLSEYEFTLQCHVLAATNDPERLAPLVNFLINSGRYQKALEVIEKFNAAYTVKQPSQTVLLCKIAVLLKMGRYDEALKIIQPLLSQFPNDPIIFNLWIETLYFKDTLWETIKNLFPAYLPDKRWIIEYKLGHYTDKPLSQDLWGFSLYSDKMGEKEARDRSVYQILNKKIAMPSDDEVIDLIRSTPFKDEALTYAQHFLNSEPHNFSYKFIYHTFRKNKQVYHDEFAFQLALYEKYGEEGTAIHLMRLASTVSDPLEKTEACKQALNHLDYKKFSAEALYQIFKHLSECFYDEALLNALEEMTKLHVKHLPLQILYGRALLNFEKDAQGAAVWVEYLINTNPYNIQALEFLADYFEKQNNPEQELIYLYRLREVRTLGNIPLTLRIIKALKKIDVQKAARDASNFLQFYQSEEVIIALINLGGINAFFVLLKNYVFMRKPLAETIWRALKRYSNFPEIAFSIPSECNFIELLKLRLQIKDYPARLQDLKLVGLMTDNIEQRTELASLYADQKEWDKMMELFPDVEFSHLLGCIIGSQEVGSPRVATLLSAWTKKRIKGDVFAETYITPEQARQIWDFMITLPSLQAQISEIPRVPMLTEIIKLRAELEDSPQHIEDLEFLAKDQTHDKLRGRLALYYYKTRQPSKAEALFPSVESTPEIIRLRTAYLMSTSQFRTIFDLSKNSDYIDEPLFKKALSLAMLEAKQYQAALQHINIFLKEIPGSGELTKLKVRALIGLGKNWTLAEDIVKEELKKDPNNKAYKRFQEEIQTAKLSQQNTPQIAAAPLPEAPKEKPAKKPSTFKPGLIEDKPVSKREKFPEKFLVKPTTDANVIRASFGSMAGQVDPLKPIVDLKAIKAEAAKGERQAAKEEKKAVERTVKPAAPAKVIAKTDLETWNRAALKYGADKLDEILKLEQGYDLLQDPLKEKIRFNNGLYAMYRSLEPISRGVVDPFLKIKLSKMRNNARHSPHEVAQKDMSDLFAYFKSKNLSQQLREWAGETGALTSLVINNPLFEIQEKAETDEGLLLRIERELQFMRDAKGKEEDFNSRTFHVNALKASLSIIGDASKKLSKPLKEKIGHLFKDFRREGDLVAHFEMNEYNEFNEISPESLWKVADRAEETLRKMKA